MRVQINETMITFAFFSIQLVGAIGLYFYYTHKNKKAEKDYWQKAGKDETL